ncbi:hypothetical protein FH609_003310 [Streptomyces sp. 3MP-14]|uniref:Uncharacterized protein n=1 Tax=Streptomyces mimosae TaxID=2586635 RepID=A0A5N5ZZI6_9ACTN|nr:MULTISPECIES: hypothetical protein [Streptomyces]KAB8161189.1 hypothetical protein FH607_026480 [Streptomyces mimosae]KAB8179000.1 hypothetical protein FH609_003310 [Streptomyces sp. 3MP-14]
MRIEGRDPRDTRWEDDEAVYRVSFWDRRVNVADEYEVRGADVDEVLGWARERAAAGGLAFTLWVLIDDDVRGLGLVRLAGVAGDPFAHPNDRGGNGPAGAAPAGD